MGKIYLDGQLYPQEKALLPVTEEGLLYGLGLFETIRVERKSPLFLKEHLERILKSAKEIDLSPPREEEMVEAVERVISENQLELGRLRLNITSNHLFIIPYEGLPYSQRDYQEGFRAITLEKRRLSSSLLPSIKSFNFLENILGKREAVKRGAHEGLFLNEKGSLTEGCVSNLFFSLSGRWITPALGEGLLAGITREMILEMFNEKNILYYEAENIPIDHLFLAQEAFLTNSLMEVMPLISCNGVPIGDGKPGPKTEEVALEYTIMKEGRILDSGYP